MKLLRLKCLMGMIAILFCMAINLNAQKPTIISFTPNATCAGISIPIFIIGENLIGTTAVTVGGSVVDSFIVTDSSVITAYISKGITGNIVITTPKGNATSDSIFTFGRGYNAYAYISNGDSIGFVSVISTVTNTIKTKIAVGKNPFGVCTSSDGSKVYVANKDSTGIISIINTANSTIMANIAFGNRPSALAISPDGSKLYVSNDISNTVSIFNTNDNSLMSTVAVGMFPDGIIVSSDGTNVYVANSGSNSISMINTTTKKITATINVGIQPHGLCLSPDGRKLYVTNYNDNSITVINTKNQSTIAIIPVGLEPFGICISPDGLKVYSANLSDNTVSVINTITNKKLSTISVGIEPNGISVSPDGSKVYVTNDNSSGNGNVSVISTSNDKVITTITGLGKYPASYGNFIVNVPTTCGELPISLLSIYALQENKTIALNWHTSTELNTANFIIQHSTDGTSFSDIGTVRAISSGANEYSFTDTHPTNGTNYYRLKSVDKDGASTYSKVVSCEWLVVSKQLAVYPNPSKSFVTVIGNHIASVQMIDNIGRVVRTVSLKDAMNPSLSVSGLQAGVYHLRVQTTDCKVSGVGFVKE